MRPQRQRFAHAPSIVVCLIALLSSSTGWAQDFAGGTGTPADPYQIETWDHFNNIRDHLSADFVLNNALTPTTAGYTTHIKDGTTLANAGQGWAPIAGCSVPGDPQTCVDFEGSLNGNHHPIVGLEIARGSTTEVGIFSRIGTAGSVKKLNVLKLSVTGGLRTGGLAGVNLGTVIRSSFSGEITGANGATGGVVGTNTIDGSLARARFYGAVQGEDRTGGLVGQNSGDLTLSLARVAVTSTQDRVGGAVGQSTGDGIVEQVFTTGSVTGALEVGGAIGETFASVAKVYSSAAVTATGGVAGGLIGKIGSTTSTVAVDESYATGTVSGNSDSRGLVGNEARSGGSAAFNVTNSFWDVDASNVGSVGTDDVGAEGKTTSDMQTQTTFTTAGWDFTANNGVWVMVEDQTYPQFQATAYADGEGSEASPYAIADWEQLNNVRLNPDAHFKLMNNLTALTPGYVGQVKNATALANGGEGWIPIGVFDNEFVGSFDGQGYAIEGLAIDRALTRSDSAEQGLFGFVGQPSGPKQGSIKDLRLADVDIKVACDPGDPPRDSHIGALIGFKQQSIDVVGVTATGTIEVDVADCDFGGARAGGLIGFHRGSLSVARAQVDLRIINASDDFDSYLGGGLVGWNQGTVSEVASEGSVAAPSAGGIIGFNDSVLVDAYSLASVTGVVDAGGVIGRNQGSQIERVYAAGEVTLTDSGDQAALVADVIVTPSASNELSFWDETVLTPIDAALGQGLDDRQMRTQSFFTDAGWDFTANTGVWAMEAGEQASYPYLQALSYDAPGTNPTNQPLPGLATRTDLTAANIEVTALSVSASPGQLTARWGPPADLKGATVTGYRVTLNGEEVCELGANDPLVCVMTGLSSSQSYTVAVSALTLEGESPIALQQSASPLAVPAAVPGAPVIESVTAGD
ncbi:MAG: hypothetical protein RI549_08395, partial [Wenzhouxiangella sp.]|nr:hypothetical protein [Wenzhouxiangella sp.]